MPHKPAIKPNSELNPSWNLYSLAIIGFVTLCQIFRWPLFPFFIDIYYHLSVMLGFHQAGGYVTHAFWEYAPVGRPHLYPPLLHILMLDLYKLGLSEIFIARLLNCFIYPLILISVWFMVSKIFKARLAFFSVVIFSAIYSFYLSITDVIPFALSLLFCLWIFYFIEKDKVISASLLLTLSFYTHTFMSWMSVLIFIFYGVLNRDKLKNCLKTIAVSLILFAPLLIYQLKNRQYFSFIDVMENYILEISLLTYLLVFFGIFAAFKRKAANYFFLALLLGMLPLAFTHKMRYLSGQGMISFIFLASVAIDNLYEKLVEASKKQLSRGILFISLFFILFYLFNPTLSLKGNASQGVKAKIAFFNSSLVKTILPSTVDTAYATETSIYNPKYADEAARIIKENSAADEIIYSNFAYAAGMFSVLSHSRATSTTMLAEVGPYRTFDQVQVAKLIVWLKNPDGKFPSKLIELIKNYKLEKIAETDLVYIYSNPNVLGKNIVQKSTVPLPAINLILLIVVAVIAYDLTGKKNS